MYLRINPSIYVREGYFYLMCSVRDSKPELVIDILEKALAAARKGEYKTYEWDSMYGTIYPDKPEE